MTEQNTKNQWQSDVWAELEERRAAYLSLPLEKRQRYEEAEAERRAARRRQWKAEYEARRANPTLQRIYELEGEIAMMYEAEEGASFYLKAAHVDHDKRDRIADELRAEIRWLKATL